MIVDALYQLKAIIASNLETIEEYQYSQSNERRTDYLSSEHVLSKESTQSSNVLRVRLILSTDGGSFLRTSQSSIWPVHALLLDLPPYERQKACNILLLGLWVSKKVKPVWSAIMKEILDNFPRRVFQISLPSRKCLVTINIFVSDLPALASTLNITQFNGDYGCPKCVHKGTVVESGFGTCRIYEAGQHTLKSVEDYQSFAEMASEMKRRICGIRGKSELSAVLSLPRDVPLDSMHLLYEGVIKLILSAMVNPKYRTHPFSIGRKSTLQRVDRMIRGIRIPHEFPRFRGLSDVKLWKAHELRNFFFYACFPLVGSLVTAPFAECLFSLLLFSLIINGHTSDNMALHDARALLDIFYCRFYSIFPENLFTINVHLLRHKLCMMMSSFSVPFGQFPCSPLNVI